MTVGAVTTKPVAAIAPTHRAPGVSHNAAPWTNPAAAAALKSSVEMLRSIEDGILKNYSAVERVKAYAPELRATNEIFAAASDAISNDAYKENDQFLPLISRAGAGVTAAEARLMSKDIVSTWPAERDEILTAIKYARMLSDNTAKQLDPGVRHP